MKRGLLKEQILATLERDEVSRNSDIRLTQVLWWTYYRRYFTKDFANCDWCIRIQHLSKLPREDHIARIRRVIQNDEKRFVPTDRSVAIKRGFDEVEAWRGYLGYTTGDTL